MPHRLETRLNSTTELVALEPSCVAVVIDVLRATTSIIHALAAGARAIVPALTVENAKLQASHLTEGTYLLAGERHGKLIQGFDLDNSPYSFTAEAVGNKVVVFTTTNGTKTLIQAEQCETVLIGSFSNLSAIVRYLVSLNRPITLLCAGTDGHVTLEDCLFAGAVANRLEAASPGNWVLDDSTQLARCLYECQGVNPDSRQAVLKRSRGGSNLLELGYERDVVRCSEVDIYDIVPQWDASSNTVTLVNTFEAFDGSGI